MKGDPGRSDTTILLRVDPDKDAIALLSIPRDLKVNIPGSGWRKFNEAYAAGGPDKTLKVVRQLTGPEDQPRRQHQLHGLRRRRRRDRLRLHRRRPPLLHPARLGVAAIDIEAGYQRMCGYNALQYVRFRHFDNDLVRSARQQDFLREARQKLPPQRSDRDRNKLLNIFTKYTTSDIGDAVPLLELLKTFLGVQSAPVREVHFPATARRDLRDRRRRGDQEGRCAVPRHRGHPRGSSRPASHRRTNSRTRRRQRRQGEQAEAESNGDHFEGPTMDDSTEQGQRYAHQISIHKKQDGDQMIDFPIYYPTRLVPGSMITDGQSRVPDRRAGEGRVLRLQDGRRRPRRHVRPRSVPTSSTASRAPTGWTRRSVQTLGDAGRSTARPICCSTTATACGSSAGRPRRRAYWVNNTLLQSLDEGQMLSIATSMREYQSK